MASYPFFTLVSSAALCALLIAQPAHTQPQGSDMFSTSGGYDRFAVGDAHRWYDNHSTETKEKSGHCLSVLDEAKAYQETAFALYAQAKQPGLDSAQITALRRKGMKQITLRGNKIRAFIDCFNQATRQSLPRSDTFSTEGANLPSDQIQTQPVPKPPSPSDKNRGKGPTRVPDKPLVLRHPQPQGQGDVFNSESSGSDEGPPVVTSKHPKQTLHRDSLDDSDCLPKIDSHVIQSLNEERNELLRALAGGGYITDLTLPALGKLLAGHLHHLTEPNEGMLSKAARTANRAIERAPVAAVKAGQMVAEYMRNDTAANHRYLYGQVESAVKKAEEALRTKLHNPHITIAEIADSFLVGRATGAVCQHWTLVQRAAMKKKADQAKEAGARWRDIRNMSPPGSNACAPAREDCFWRTLHNATGDPSYQLRTKQPTWNEVYDKLKQHFGGANTKDPLTGRPGDLQKMAEGWPVPVTTDEFVKVLKRMPNNSEGMVFIGREDRSTHVFNLAKFAGSHLYWDDQVRSSNMDILFAGAKTISWFRYK